MMRTLGRPEATIWELLVEVVRSARGAEERDG